MIARAIFNVLILSIPTLRTTVTITRTYKMYKFNTQILLCKFLLYRDNRYVLRAGLSDALEAALGTLHVLIAGETKGESGISMDGWNAEFLKSEYAERAG